MALHDTVVRRIKVYHERLGDDVSAELANHARPPKFFGPHGAAYIPDVFVPNRGIAYEVKEYNAGRNAAFKLKAIERGAGVRETVLVLCTGTPDGVPRVRAALRERGVRCKVLNYRELPFW